MKAVIKSELDELLELVMSNMHPSETQMKNVVENAITAMGINVLMDNILKKTFKCSSVQDLTFAQLQEVHHIVLSHQTILKPPSENVIPFKGKKIS